VSRRGTLTSNTPERRSDTKYSRLTPASDAVQGSVRDLQRMLSEVARKNGLTLILIGGGEPARLQAGGLTVGDAVLDLDAHLVRRGTSETHLTPRECVFLERLAVDINRTVPRTDLVQAVWGGRSGRGPHSLRVLVKNLRRKLEPDPVSPRYLVTESAVGYRLQLG